MAKSERLRSQIFKQLSDLPSDDAFWKNEWMFTHSVFMQESRQMKDKVAFWEWFKTLPIDLKRFINCVAYLK